MIQQKADVTHNQHQHVPVSMNEAGGSNLSKVDVTADPTDDANTKIYEHLLNQLNSISQPTTLADISQLGSSQPMHYPGSNIPQPILPNDGNTNATATHRPIARPGGNAANPLYFGLAGTNSTDGHAAIDFFDPNKGEFLEYDLAKLVYQLSGAKKPVVGWLSELPMSAGFDPVQRPAARLLGGARSDPAASSATCARWTTMSAASIRPSMSWCWRTPSTSQPRPSSPSISSALRGGHILAFVDPLADQDPAGADPANPAAALTADRASHLGSLLTAWGVDFDSHQVVADSTLRHERFLVTRRRGPGSTSRRARPGRCGHEPEGRHHRGPLGHQPGHGWPSDGAQGCAGQLRAAAFLERSGAAAAGRTLPGPAGPGHAV